MTRAARRVTTVTLAALSLLLVSVLVLVDPALAADSEPAHAVAREASGFGTGLWDGMMLAAGFGVLLGFVVFGMSSPGEIDRAGHGHEDHGDQQMAP